MCDCDVLTQAYWAKRMVARKRHRCHECFREIFPGNTYERVRAIWDNEPVTTKTCADCLAIRDAVTGALPDRWCWCHGELLQNVRDEISEWPPDDPTRAHVETLLEVVKR